MTRVKALMVGACLGLSIPAASQAAAAPPVAVERGDHYGTRIFPDNAFTVADSSQVTGRRVNFRQGVDFPSVGGVILAACTTADYSICDAFSQLNKLDGFDLQQRVTVPFTQNGINDEFLAASVPPSVNNPISGIERTNQVNVDPTAPGAFQSSAAPNLIPPGAAGYYAFGSFLSPRYQFASASGHQDDPYGVSGGFTDGEIPPVPTTQTPKPFGADRLGVIAVTPDPTLFPPPWPAAIYGPGFTRSDYDLFVTADYNASLGIVTLATDPSGHGFGPLSTTTVTSNGTPTTFLSYGRGRDLNGDGIIGDGLTEALPLRDDPAEVITHPGAAALQELFGATNWYDRTGSPETFAPRIRLRPDSAWASNPKNVVFQSAYADGTTTDPAAGVIYRAGQLFDRVVFYRNDKTPTYASDPHGWLANPALAGRTSGEQQLGAFLSTGQLVNTNPAWLEVPAVNPNNFECLHYPDPQTGQQQTRQPYPASGDCPPLSPDG